MIGNKGVSENAVDGVVAIFFTVLLFFILVLVVFGFKERSIDSTLVEGEVYFAKTYYTQQLFASSDTLSFGTIDIARFKDLDKNNSYQGEYVGAQFTLKDMFGNNLTGFPNPIYNNKKVYNDLYAFAANNIAGAGGAKLMNITYPVAIKDGNIIRPGLLYIELVVPR
jgi:hypothetical protein